MCEEASLHLLLLKLHVLTEGLLLVRDRLVQSTFGSFWDTAVQLWQVSRRVDKIERYNCHVFLKKIDKDLVVTEKLMNTLTTTPNSSASPLRDMPARLAKSAV